MNVSDDEFVSLVKGAAEEGELFKFENKELKDMLSIAASYPNDKELCSAISIIKSEIAKRNKFNSFRVFLWAKKWPVIVILSILLLLNFTIRYETEQVGGRLIRYDRLLSHVEMKSVFGKSDWHKLRYENLQQAKAVFQKRDMEAAAEKDLEEIKHKIDELNDDIRWAK